MEESNSEEDTNKTTVSIREVHQVKKLDFLNKIVLQPSLTDLRFLELFDQRNQKRMKKWVKVSETEILEQNAKRLRTMISMNFSQVMNKKY